MSWKKRKSRLGFVVLDLKNITTKCNFVILDRILEQKLQKTQGQLGNQRHLNMEYLLDKITLPMLNFLGMAVVLYRRMS